MDTTKLQAPTLRTGLFGALPASVMAAIVLALATVLLVMAQPAGAAFPGANGKIAFMSDRDGDEEVFVMDPDGTDQTNLTNNPAVDLQPSWSPDGKKIAFTSKRDDNQEIYLMNPDGSGQTNLTNNPADDFQPSWSPDGKKIAFHSNRDRDSQRDVYVMNSNGTGQTNLTNNLADDDAQPAFSP